MRRADFSQFLLLQALLGLAACQQADEATEAKTEASPGPASQLEQLYHDYDEEYLALNPIDATFRGDYRYNDRWYPHDPLSDQYLSASYELNRRYLARLDEIDPATLGDEERISYDVFRYDREHAVERHDLGYDAFEQLTPVNQFWSLPGIVVMMGSGAAGTPFRTVKDYDDWIRRSNGFAGFVEFAIARMREGVELGVVQPRVLMEKTLPQLEAQLVENPEQSDFWLPVAQMPESFSDAERAAVAAKYRQHIRDVLVPAYAKLHDYIRDEYLPHTRDTVGQGDVPGGADYYAFLVRESTTTDYTPEEIHDIGKREAQRIYAQMEKVKDMVGFAGTMQEFFEHLRRDPAYYHDDEQALLDDYEALRARINPALDRLFDLRPKSDYVIRPVEAFRAQSMAAAQYFQGTPDGSRPGIFYVNTFDLASRPDYMMEAVSLHEASPGHHFQVSIAQELDNLPAFRRFGSYTAFDEGWGLYAESLGQELGLYGDPMQYFGWLYLDIWRANRLVVDTGMHALGWSREDAIAWMKSNSPITDTDVIAEVERYIAIPAQALGYKVGQLKIRELRTRAEAALGEDFDVREFHRQVLDSGSLPMVVLELKIDRWIAARQGQPSEST